MKRGSWLIWFANTGPGTRGIGLSDRRYWIAPLGAHLIASWPSKWRGHPRFRAPAGRPATDCDILSYPRPRKRGIIPDYKYLVKRVTPSPPPRPDLLFHDLLANGPWERDLSRSVLWVNLRIDKLHKYIIVVARKDCERSSKMVARGAVMFVSTRVDAYRRAFQRFYRRDGSLNNRWLSGELHCSDHVIYGICLKHTG